MILAFYAWTDTSLINAVKVKEGYYKNESADLFILKLPRISHKLVGSIKKLGIFDAIYWLDEPHESILPVLRKPARLLGGDYYYSFISEQLRDVRFKKYDILFVGGLWSYALFVYKLLRKSNPQLKISIVEEGTVNYGGASTICWCEPHNRQKDYLLRNILYKDIFSKACKNITELYLSNPDGCINKDNLKIKQIKEYVNALVTISDELMEEDCLRWYQSRSVVLFTQPESEVDIKMTKMLVDILKRYYGASQIIVRIHPNQELEKSVFELDPEIVVDDASIPFEVLLPKVDWSNKTLIARASSCLFKPFYALKEQPYLFFVYRFYAEKDNRLISELALRIKKLYSDEDRVQIPNNIEEFVEGILFQTQVNNGISQ